MEALTVAATSIATKAISGEQVVHAALVDDAKATVPLGVFHRGGQTLSPDA